MIKKAFTLGLGAGLLGYKIVEKAVNDLKKSGVITEVEGKKIVKRYLVDSKKHVDQLKKDMESLVKKKVDEQVTKTIRRLDLVTKKDYNRLERKLLQLEKKLAPSTTVRKTNRRKPAKVLKTAKRR